MSEFVNTRSTLMVFHFHHATKEMAEEYGT